MSKPTEKLINDVICINRFTTSCVDWAFLFFHAAILTIILNFYSFFLLKKLQ